MVVFGGLVALLLRWRPRGLLDEPSVLRMSLLLRRLVNTRRASNGA